MNILFNSSRSFIGACASALSIFASIALLSGCGGGGSEDAAVSAAALPGGEARAVIQSVGASPAAAAAPVLTVRAKADLAAGVGAMMTVRVDGKVVGTVEVKTVALSNYSFTAPGLKAGSKVDVVFTNDAVIAGQDRNLYVAYLASGSQLVFPTSAGSLVDKGVGSAAFDGVDTLPGQSKIAWNGALRSIWPAAPAADATLTARNAAARLLMQATFGPTAKDIARLSKLAPATWIDEQIALPFTPDYVDAVQARYVKGDAWRPRGANFDAAWVPQTFWASTVNAPDQLRRRMGWALHQIFMVSQADSNQWLFTRAYANYLDTLNKDAFGNYRTLLEDMALSPAMGIYLSHIRNRKEDPSTGRMPDENFAREAMQLFSIGLYELNIDGSLKLNAAGKPIETYSNADVMALAKVFTGFSWAFPDNELTENNFRWGNPSLSAANDTKIDLQRMKAYPGQHSTAEKKLFSGKAGAVVLPAGGTASDDLRLALDALFKHPNVGPFIGRQLIQHLVVSNPSPAYVSRVATVFNDDGHGVRGNLAAVVKAILLDTEARTPGNGSSYGKLREPVLRVAHWMRAFNARSTTGDFKVVYDLSDQSQQALAAPSVFGYYRPGYVPPTPSFAATALNAPELQIVNESSTAAWVNLAQAMSAGGIGWMGTGRDVVGNIDAQTALSASGNFASAIDNLNLLLFSGQMSGDLRTAIADAAGDVAGSTAASHADRVRLAVFLALAANEYQVQR
jgi:uncharacterized protein (DUF1800 family)